jgi:hypothetical protein
MSNTDSNSKRESNSGLDYNIFKYFNINTFNKFSYNYNNTIVDRS